MNSSYILPAAILAFSAGAYAQTAQALDGAAQPAQQQVQSAGAEPHQHRYVTIGRDRAKIHLDRPTERSGSFNAQSQGQEAATEPHQHRYVTIGRDRTKVHLDHPMVRSGRSAAAMGGPN